MDFANARRASQFNFSRAWLRLGLSALVCLVVLAPVGVDAQVLIYPTDTDPEYIHGGLISIGGHNQNTPGNPGTLNPTVYDVDSDGGSTDSSSDVLAVPVGATIVRAVLYWNQEINGTRGAPNRYPINPADASMTRARFTVGGSSMNVSADEVGTSTLSGITQKWAWADVTTQVRANAPAAMNTTVITANIADGSMDCAWVLHVVFERASDPVRAIRVYAVDLPVYGTAGVNEQIIDVQRVPVPDGATAEMTFHMTNGQIGWAGGEGYEVDGTALNDMWNPAGNAYNGSRSVLGVIPAGANPPPRTTFMGAAGGYTGLDLDVMDASSALTVGTDKHRIRYAVSSAEYAFIHTLGFSVTTGDACIDDSYGVDDGCTASAPQCTRCGGAARCTPRSRHFDNWVFGDSCRLSWDGDLTVSPSGGATINTTEGVATFSDPQTGELLLYTDGIRAYNGAGAIISTSNLGGNPSTKNSGVIFPRPGNPDRYFVVGNFNIINAARYTEFDLATGPGAQVGTPALIGGFGSSGEGLAAVPHDNETDYWLIGYQPSGKRMLVSPVTSAGIGAATPFDGLLGAVSFHSAGIAAIVASADSRMIAFVSTTTVATNVVVMDFDPTTGALSNARTLGVFPDPIAYGIAFSPTGRQLYVSSGGSLGVNGTGRVYRYDVISGARTLVGQCPDTGLGSSLQLAPDGKMYLTQWESGRMCVVEDPDLFSGGAVFTVYPITIPGCRGFLSSPTALSAFSCFEAPACLDSSAGGIDNGCDASAPHCDTEISSGSICVSCADDAHCAGDGVCDRTSGTCVNECAWEWHTPTGATSMPTLPRRADFPIEETYDRRVDRNSGYAPPLGDPTLPFPTVVSYTFSAPVSAKAFTLWNDVAVRTDNGISLMDVVIRDGAGGELIRLANIRPNLGLTTTTVDLGSTFENIASFDLIIRGADPTGAESWEPHWREVALFGPRSEGAMCAGGVCNGDVAAPACVECVADAACDDGDECTDDACVSNACVNSPAMAGTMCAGGVCDGAAVPSCVECVTAVQCDDGNACTTDSCVSGACSSLPFPAGTMCMGGVCDGAAMPSCVECVTAAECDDANDCTTDTCLANACSTTPVVAGVMCVGGVCDGSGSCSGCVDDAGPGVTDSGCMMAAPICDPTTAACEECLVSADCTEGVCEMNTCVTCTDTASGSGIDNGCLGTAPICDGAAGPGTPGTACQPCVDNMVAGTDSGCEVVAAIGPVCDTTGVTHTCVACEDSDPSPAGLDNGCEMDEPVCLDAVGMAPSCVGCIVDADCPEMGEVCGAGNTCVPGCDDVSDCAGTATPLCDLDARECVECLVTADCAGTELCEDSVCVQPDADMDGVPDDEDLDDDNDGIPDAAELGDVGLAADEDGDGVIDFQDPSVVDCADDDSDGICDALPPEIDMDGDGIANHLDLDADGDGITDIIEAGGEDDGDGVVDTFEDINGNGLADSVEAAPLPLPNTDGTDGPDFLDIDADDDGLPDALEGHDADHDGVADVAPSGTDADEDGLDDAFDPDAMGTPAATPDLDEDGEPDFQDEDDDDDGVLTATEVIDAMEYDGPAASGDDVDGDGLPNWFDTDSDGDGADDGAEDSRPEEDGDLDDNDLLDYLDPGFSPNDSDMDGVPDLVECPDVRPPGPDCVDSDGDGTPDYLDADDDNDGTLTIDEGGDEDGDSDGDGIVDRLDLDSDNDGIPDTWETGAIGADMDRDGRADDATDADGDGVAAAFDDDDSDPAILGGLAPPDTDGDGIADKLDLDADGDGLRDVREADDDNDTLDADGDGRVDAPADIDMDGLYDVVDPDAGGTPHAVVDTDEDGVPDFLDLDSDDDTVPDAVEAHDADADGEADVAPSGDDVDGDGIDDAYAAAPSEPDTDEDGAPDWRDRDDDGDGVWTRFENPTAQDTDGDGAPDYLDDDDDGDGIPTADETPDANSDGDPSDATDEDDNGVPDYLDPELTGDDDGGFSGGALCAASPRTGGAPTRLLLLIALCVVRRRRR